MVLPNLKSPMPGFNHLEEILSPGLLAESIARVLEPDAIREMIQCLNQVLDDSS
ncbi:MAG: hypothetical protein ACE5OZ_20225 [Candidatus Heimdallarchaeota archaeon]